MSFLIERDHMKKSLLAVAIATAFTAPAMAQSSSVEIYGIIDAGVGKLDDSVTTNVHIPMKENNEVAHKHISDFSVGQKTITSGLGSINNAPSRLGFRGKEDLGMGNQAGFVVEFGIDPSASTQTLTTREAYAYVGNKDFGQLAIGTQHTPAHKLLTMNSPAETSTIVGGLIGKNDFVGVRTPMISYTINPAGSPFHATFFYGNQRSTRNDQNSASYVDHNDSKNNESQSINTDTVTGNKESLGLGFTYKDPEGLTAGYVYQQAPVSIGAVTGICRMDQNKCVSLIDDIDNNYLSDKGDYRQEFSFANPTAKSHVFSVKYKLGMVTPYASYITQTTDGKVGVETFDRDAKTWQLGVAVEPSSQLRLFASYLHTSADLNITTSKDKKTDINSMDASGHGYQLGATYAFSKRTNLYALYATEKSDIKYGTIYDKYADINVTKKVSQYGVGLKHSF